MTANPADPPADPPGEPTRPTTPLSQARALSAALLLTPLLVALLYLTLPDGAADILLDRDNPAFPLTIQDLMWLVFAVGVAELSVRLSATRAEQAQLKLGYLPEDDTTLLQGPELRQVYQRTRRLAAATAGEQRRFLPQLISRIILQFQTSHSIDQANSLLNSSLELSLHEIDLRYSTIRYVVWAIPTLGFIGTVVGISLALAYAGQVDVQDPTLLAELTKRLAVAFNTTLLALVMSALLVLVQHIAQRREEGTLNEAGQYCLDNLINRLYEG